MSNRLALLGLAASLGVTGCLGGGDPELVVANRSDYALQDIRITRVDEPIWGPNLLPGVLLPGEDLGIANIDCGLYDVLVVDERGADCELHDNDLCFEDGRWVIDNLPLHGCVFAAPTEM